jgi:hypothetical protein
MHCTKCNSYRRLGICWKCGSTTIEPHPKWDYPQLPDVDKIRSISKEVGYAIGVHGSLEKDLDLIAAPWTKDAIGNEEFIAYLAEKLGATVLEIEIKPVGRLAASIQLDGWYKVIDLSVCPIIN